MIVLGIDPGLANTGWGVIETRGSVARARAYGCIHSEADEPLHERLGNICQQIGEVIERYAPTAVSIEDIFFGQNTRSAILTAHARGAALVACSQAGVEVGSYTPMQIKQAVVGTGAADKRQVTYMVRNVLSLDHDPKPDHCADALAAAVPRQPLEDLRGLRGAGWRGGPQARGGPQRPHGFHRTRQEGGRMIVQLTGTLVELTASVAVLDVSGVGYELGISSVTASGMPEVGTPGVTLLTRLVVREDSMTLFGFSTREERALFDRLCAISGVGPKLALAVLSTFTPSALAGVVVAQDASMMSSVPGVGKKLASRLLLELESVFAKDPTLVSLAGAAALPSRGTIAVPAVASSGVADDVTAALLAMGFTSEEATLALEGYEEAGATTTKAALSYALKRLGRRS